MPDESGLIRFVKIAELACPECAMVLQRVSIVQKGMTKMMYLHRGSGDIGCQYVGKYFLVPVEFVAPVGGNG
jgi:hypothetical protein